MSGKTAKDIMGRENCSSIMPCYVCRQIKKFVPLIPKETYEKMLTKYEKII